MNTVTRFCLIRHGETDWNVARRLQGHTDIPLNAHGLQQAELVARHLPDHPFSALYVSDLTRTRQTAAPLARRTGLLPMATPALRERHYGVLQGLSPEDMARDYPEETRQYHQRDTGFTGGSGESLQALHDRITRLMQKIANQHRGEYVLIVTHGGVLDIVHRWVTEQPLHTPRTFPIPNAALNWLSYSQNRGWQIDAWAEQLHLDTALDEL